MSENGYMEPVDEWEREALLDPGWERQQKKTFTAWCNSHLRKAGSHIDEIDTDFRNGLKLMLLLEVISGETLQRPDRGKMRFHQIANVNKALEFIQSKGVRLMVCAEEIVDGNLKMTLGMIWTIILRFAIQDISIEEISAKEGLLLWCQRKTSSYKNVNVQNFHISFKDGLAFCALIHRHRPELIDYNSLVKENPVENLNLAFEVAECHLDIPKMLDADEIDSSVRPDEKSIMTYVSSYYHAFAGAQKVETAANRICKLLSLNRDADNLIQSYNSVSEQLLIWISAKIVELTEASNPSENLLEAQQKLQTFRTYRMIERPGKIADKAKIETDYRSLQTRMRLNNKPAFVPVEGRTVKDIADRWKKLESCERYHEETLLKELRRLQRLDHLLRKFHTKCKAHDEWVEGKEEVLGDDESLSNCRFHDIKALRRKHEAFQSDLAAHQDRVEQINAIVQELNTLEYADVDQINLQCQRICTQWNKLGDMSQYRAKRLREYEVLFETLDGMFLEYAKRASLFVNWLDNAREDLQDTLFVHSIDEIRALIDGHQHFKSTLSEAEKEHDELVHLHAEAQVFASRNKLSNAENPYTNISSYDIQTKWKAIKELIPQRDLLLQQEYKNQQANETLRLEFAKRANQIADWIDESNERLTFNSSSNKSLEDQLTNLKNINQNVANFQSNMDELESCNHNLQKAMIFENVHSIYSIDSLRMNFHQLVCTVNEQISELDYQIMMRDSKGISEEQLCDLRTAFTHFDKDQTGHLEHKEFRSCLIALGYSIREDKQGDNEFRQITSVVDPLNTGLVSFDAFVDFMTRELSEDDSVDQLIHSFRTLSAGEPFITEDQIRNELPSDQAEYCIGRMKPYVGLGAPEHALDYKEFITTVYGQTNV